jgi:SAM-dependent methyltransferase
MTLTGDLQRMYDRRFGPEARRAKAEVWKAIVEGYLQRFVAPTDRVLDVGCGMGEFLNHVRCAKRTGIDLNPAMKASLDPAVEFRAGDVRDLSFLADESQDLVFTSNLIEHLPSKADVERLFRECARVLRPGGHFLLLGPNLRFLPGEYWDFWDHLVPITDRSLVEALETIGFEVVDAIPRFLPYTTRSSLPKSPWLVRLYLAAPIAWRFLGGQFLVRAKKP